MKLAKLIRMSSLERSNPVKYISDNRWMEP